MGMKKNNSNLGAALKKVREIQCSLLVNSFMTEVPITETSRLICRANQSTSFYMIVTSVMKELTRLSSTNFTWSILEYFVPNNRSWWYMNTRYWSWDLVSFSKFRAWFNLLFWQITAYFSLILGIFSLHSYLLFFKTLWQPCATDGRIQGSRKHPRWRALKQ